MKTMEEKRQDVFHVGKHCEESSCNRLDFLPVKCDGCRKTFCNDHFRYEQHKCSSGRVMDNQVPVCPLCNAPVSVKRGEVPDIRIGQHMDADCQSDTAVNQRKVYSNPCSVKGCKKKEMIRVDCQKCQKSHCLAHRLPEDHECKGPVPASSRAGAAALARFASSSKPSPVPVPVKSAQTRPVQTMSEDEALARALQMSLATGDSSATSSPQRAMITPPASQEEEDLALAQALAASEAEHQAAQQNTRKTNCVMS